MKFGIVGLAAAVVLTASSLTAATPAAAAKITEPKKIKSAEGLKDGEGAVQLSIRTQKQFIETAIVYFVALDTDGADSERVYRFERGAGVPIMGSNMIDEKQAVYRLPAGRYRPLAFTVACDQMPFADGLVCTRGFARFPTGYFGAGPAVFEVKPGHLTRAGDYVIEFTGAIPDPTKSLFEYKQDAHEWGLRWRPAGSAASGFAALPALEPTVPDAMRSRIACNARPAGVTLFIPFAC